MVRKKLRYPYNVWDELCGEFERIKKVNLPGGYHKGRFYKHILPFNAEELQNYFTIDSSLLPSKFFHDKINHLNSSQLLCYNVFAPLLKEGYSTGRLSKFLDLPVAEGKQCFFEYKDDMRWNEGKRSEDTQFDFYISKSENDKTEIFFEVKFTENGFGKPNITPGDYHEDKASFYLEKLEGVVKKINGDITKEDVFNHYQIFRNIIRTRDKHKNVVFITDANNKATLNQIKTFKNEYMLLHPERVKFMFWQDLFKRWPDEVEKPFQYACFIEA